MKNFKFSFILIAVAVVIVASSCTTSQMVTDENMPQGRQYGNRIYLDDPYLGTVVLERDPYTGRYYDVTYGMGGGMMGYNPYMMNRFNNPYMNRNMRGTRTIITPQQPTAEQVREQQKNREEARRKVLGN